MGALLIVDDDAVNLGDRLGEQRRHLEEQHRLGADDGERDGGADPRNDRGAAAAGAAQSDAREEALLENAHGLLGGCRGVLAADAADVREHGRALRRHGGAQTADERGIGGSPGLVVVRDQAHVTLP